MSNAQVAVSITTANPTQAQLDQLAAAIGQGIGNIAAHETGHQLVNWFASRQPPIIVNGMDMEDNSTDTYNSLGCDGSTAPWNYTGFYNGNPIHWSPNADQSLINLYGKKP